MGQSVNLYKIFISQNGLSIQASVLETTFAGDL